MTRERTLDPEYLDRLTNDRRRETNEAVELAEAASVASDELVSRTAETIASAREAIARTHEALGKRRGG